MQTLFGIDLPLPYIYIASLAITALLIAMFGLVLKRFKAMTNPLNRLNGKNRQPRLGVVDTFTVDRQRQLVIVRRDNVEHLILIGGTTDLLIEANIVRSAANSPSLPREAQQFAARNRANPTPTNELTRRETQDEPSPAPKHDPFENDRRQVETQSTTPPAKSPDAPDLVKSETSPVADHSKRLGAAPFFSAVMRPPVSRPLDLAQTPTIRPERDDSVPHDSLVAQSNAPQQLPRTAPVTLPSTAPSSEKRPSGTPESLDDNLRRLLIRRPTNQP